MATLCLDGFKSQFSVEHIDIGFATDNEQDFVVHGRQKCKKSLMQQLRRF